MCGIIGVFSTKAKNLDMMFLDSCRDTLRHRGPDKAGSFRDRGLYLGFRRLAILDLSPGGDQPMTSCDGRYTIVFNGEIYNFVELRAELESQGARIRSRSDTEILLQLYAKHGIQSLDKLNGMFAFAIYDRMERTLVLVRDRLGVKPLFYWKHAQEFAFASEIRALRKLPGFPTAVQPEALGLYFRLGAVPEWTGVFRGLSKLAPGTWIRYHLDSGTVEGPFVYWNLPAVGEEEGKTEEDWLDEIESLLWDATRIRLRAEVPLGVFLSGGIDSGLVASAAASQLNGLTSLTIGFAGEPQDETTLAQATGRHLGLSALTRAVSPSEGLETLPQTMAHFDEPFSDTSALPTSLICGEARREFTVVLSGDGGDEVFGGYENHVRAWQWRGLDRLPLSWRRTFGSFFASHSHVDSLAKRFFMRLCEPVGRFGLGSKVYPFQDWLDGCIKPEFNLDPGWIVNLYNQHLSNWVGASSIDLAQRTDLRCYMLENILTKVDRMSMMHALEVRSPFLDYRLIELGLKVPSRLRAKNGSNKYLLRRLATRHLPEAVSLAPKRGFGIPIESWLSHESHARALATTMVTTPAGQLDPFVEGGAERLWHRVQENSALIPALVRLLCYRWWCMGE